MKLKFAVIGTGFWSNFQIPGWFEAGEVELVAVYNRTRAKAEAFSSKFGGRVYDRVEQLLEFEDLDFVDIITDVDTHRAFAEQALRLGRHVVCQKPLAPSLAEATHMVDFAQRSGAQLFVNENFRWQAPIRRVKALLLDGAIGRVFRSRVSFCSAFPVFDNQPFLAELERFILTDIGSHVLDICRFLFGEVDSLYCRTARVNPGIRGEDVASVLMHLRDGVHCFAEMSYASRLEREVFPQTLLLIEGSEGSIRLGPDFAISVTTRAGTVSETVRPKLYEWGDPAYAVVHSSIVDAQRDLLTGLRGGRAETTGADNLETARLVWASYASAERNALIHVPSFHG